MVFADKKFYVEENVKVKKILSVLPGINCGACGFAGCKAFAEALAASDASAKTNGCPPGGANVASEIANITGSQSTGQIVPKTAKIRCKGGRAEAKERAIYDGINDCFAAVLVAGGSKECSFGCLGFGNCVAACPFGAISINKNQIAVVDNEKCCGCVACVASCPRDLIDITPDSQKIFLACNNHNRGANVRSCCSVGCTGCTICIKAVVDPNAIEMENNLPKLNYKTSENFILAMKKCPSNSFTDLAKGRPTVNIDMQCNGCGKCVEICPVKGAIVGEKGKRHSVNKNLCIGCGRCISSCEIRAIRVWGSLAHGDISRSSKNASYYS
jgi:Na+-translocating ferredoxin:NAD+ oxidoreductase RNF subunit RnfB